MSEQQTRISELLNHGNHRASEQVGSGGHGEKDHQDDKALENRIQQLQSDLDKLVQAQERQAKKSDLQERYVTSTAIESVRKKIDQDVKQFFTDVKGYIDDTDIPFPGWGTLGSLFIGWQYATMQHDMRSKADDGYQTADDMVTKLGTIKDNWRKAEEASTVVYQ